MDRHWSTRNLAHTHVIFNHLMGGLIIFLSTAKSSIISFSRSGRAHAMYIVCLLLVVFIWFVLLIIFAFALFDSAYYFCSNSFCLFDILLFLFLEISAANYHVLDFE